MPGVVRVETGLGRGDRGRLGGGACATIGALVARRDGVAGRTKAPFSERRRSMAGASTLEFTDANFESEVLGSSAPVLVDFWAEWCQPCKMLAPTIDDVAEHYGDKAKVGKLDIDNNRDVAMKFGISAIPTVLVFQNGEVKKQFVGLTRKEDIVEAMDALV